MDISAITGLTGIDGLSALERAERTSLTGTLTDKEEKVGGSLFDAFLNSAINNIKTTNSYLSRAEDEELKFAMGETENFHDLTIALQKASTALQYTVAVRDRLLDAYKELMQMQI
ncbi:MAG: flagellar hook-basal body complex protein FliE [Lachnospiraceae bacterium]|uniref:flagellar hook-basal body complex protein FliE n=1 Tax=uncultured Acetatifactor sp. TaxID=1671927 RepID=UPI002610CC93|nr:flagellar hook-basal body complex protein FliE [uncultured Acetatifactor sp.]MCI8788824.1 flagellar hook-basal body complex protein FliE [Lachnospiraceae bacterium]